MAGLFVKVNVKQSNADVFIGIYHRHLDVFMCVLPDAEDSIGNGLPGIQFVAIQYILAMSDVLNINSNNRIDSLKNINRERYLWKIFSPKLPEGN